MCVCVCGERGNPGQEAFDFVRFEGGDDGRKKEANALDRCTDSRAWAAVGVNAWE